MARSAFDSVGLPSPVDDYVRELILETILELQLTVNLI
jgi:hypothetical protein